MGWYRIGKDREKCAGINRRVLEAAEAILGVRNIREIGPHYIFPAEGQCLKFRTGWNDTYDSWTDRKTTADLFVEITWDYLDEPLLPEEKVAEFTEALKNLTDGATVSFSSGEEDDDGHMWREWTVSFGGK